jgi:hypothetical protein
VVDDHDVGAGNLAPRLEIEALLVGRAVFPEAVAAVALNQVPHGWKGLKRQIAFAPLLRLIGPKLNVA